MSQSAYPSSGSDPLTLLRRPIASGFDDWQAQLKGRKSFRVHGLPWFRENIEKDRRKLEAYVPEVIRAVRERPQWQRTIEKPSPFSINQFSKAEKYEPLLFEKAALVVLLAEIAAEHGGRSSEEVYEHLYIEPAVFTIPGFDRDALSRARSRRPDIMETLRQRTKQGKNDVFFDLASGKTVSFAVADTVLKTISEVVPDLRLGEVEVGLGRAHRMASTAEIDPNEPWPNK